MTRRLHDIALDIQRDWKNPYFGAVPYIEAMTLLTGINDMYGADRARDIVSYFLGNARTWRGPKAREIKAELNAMLNH
jgi:hypothetical protein